MTRSQEGERKSAGCPCKKVTDILHWKFKDDCQTDSSSMAFESPVADNDRTMDRMPPCNLQPSTTSPSEEQISNFQLCDVSCRSEHIYSNQDTWTESSPKNVLDLESMFSELSPPTTESPPESHHLASGISLVFSPPSNGCTELTQPIETVVGNNELSNLMSHEPPSTEPPGSYYVSLPIVLEESMTPPMSSSEEIKLPPRRSRRRRKKVSPLDPAIEFDPGRHSLSDEELKPRPMIYKTRKLLIPNEMKDEDYWERRKKNNDAAKRSRDIKRMKEARIKMRLAHLEKENVALRQEVSELKRVNAALSEDMANLSNVDVFLSSAAPSNTTTFTK